MNTEQKSNEDQGGGSALNELLAGAIGAAAEDFGEDHLQTLLLIGQGMFWSKELDIAARELADKVKEEFKLFSNENCLNE